MLFVFDPPVRPGFYMKNTAIPLDILFIDVSNRIMSIHRMEPFNEKDIHQPPGPARFALPLSDEGYKKLVSAPILHRGDAIGTMILSRRFARSRFSNWPPHSTVYPSGRPT